MQIHLNKTRISVGFVIFLLIASLTSIAMPIKTVQAQTGVTQIGTSPTNVYGYPKLGDIPPGVTADFTFDKHAFLSFRPNPIGVGQTLLVNMWTCPGSYHAFYMQGYKVTIEKPDGTSEVVSMNSYVADCTAWFEYIPDQAGTYRLKFDAPGTYIPAGKYVDRPGVLTSANYTLPHSVYYKPSSTDWQNLTVQANLVASWPTSPLPTDYWTRPVNVINRDWWPILGNYPFDGGAYYYPNGRILYGQAYYQYTAYVQAPNTAHVVWKRQGANAGMMGGMAYQFSTSSSPGNPSIVYNGRCYQTVTKPMLQLVNGTYRTLPKSVWECYDLRTGEIYWDLTDVTAPTLIEYNPPGSSTIPGGGADMSYTASLMAISGGRIIKYNPYTGAVNSNVSIAPLSSATYYMPQYCLSVQDLGVNATAIGRYRLINWTTAGTSTNFTSRIAPRADGYRGQWNISWPTSSLSTAGCIDYDAGIAVTIGPNSVFENEMGVTSGIEYNIGHIAQSVDLHTGNILFSMNTNDTLTETAGGQNRIVDHGKIALAVEGMHINCYDGRTGEKLWTSEQLDYPWGNWHAYGGPATYDFNESKGAIISTTYAGIYAIDWDNGKILWHFTDPSVPFEGPYGDTPYFTTVKIADGKIYAYNGEHSPSEPYDRGWSLYCINATNGQLIWKILNPMVPGAVADGYLTAANNYDGYMYVFGKGKSDTTVTAPDTVVAKGTGLVIKGTVLDISPAQPNTPCVSKESMTTQMQYLHIQQPIDGIWHNETISGVPVALTAIDANGNVIDIGTTTTNGYYGTFGYSWTPPNEGEYTVMASFAGDDSYGSSASATTVSVGPAPTTAPTQSPIAQTDYAPTLMGILAAVVVAIIVSVIALVAVIKKRP